MSEAAKPTEYAVVTAKGAVAGIFPDLKRARAFMIQRRIKFRWPGLRIVERAELERTAA